MEAETDKDKEHEVYIWQDKELLVAVLKRLWVTDRELWQAFTNCLIVTTTTTNTQPLPARYIVLPGRAEQAFMDEAQRRGLLE